LMEERWQTVAFLRPLRVAENRRLPTVKPA